MGNGFRSRRSRDARASRSTTNIAIDALERRRLFAASGVEIAQALELPSGTEVSYSGDARAVRVATATATGGLLGLPSGADNDFLMLSTGVASEFTNANTSGSQGTDLGDTGADGDTATISFSLDVPASSTAQKLKFDFIFLSEEYMEYVGSTFNDVFTATVNGTNIALDQSGNVVSVNNVLFDGTLSTNGTFFDGRTPLLAATYLVPSGVSTLNVVFSIADVGDGIYDSGVMLDNVRFETVQTFWLDFGASTLTGFMAPLTGFSLSPFFASTLGTTDSTTAEVEDSIVATVQLLFASYDCVVTKSKPVEGEYMHVSVTGNSNDAKITLYSPLAAYKHGSFEPKFRDWLNIGKPPGDQSALMGQSQAIDLGNLNRNDRAMIFAGEFKIQYPSEDVNTLVTRLARTIAHEMGHNLGLRHIDNSQSNEIMKQFAPRSLIAVFNNQLYDLAEPDWPDKATNQNSDAYLRAVLGTVGGGSGAAPSGNQKASTRYFTVDFTGYNLADATLAISDGEESADITGQGQTDGAPVIMEFATLNGPKVIEVPAGMANPQVFFAGSSVPGGPMDVFSGTVSGGTIADNDGFLPLFDANGNPQPVPLAKGAPDALTQLQAAPVTEVNASAATILTNNRGTFTDADGDTYTVSLSGQGTVAMALDDGDGDGKGSIAQVALTDTAATSSLSITVRKAGGGDGLVTLAQLSGNGPLKSLNAAKVNLSGAISLSGQYLGSVKLNSIAGTASVTTGGDPSQKTSLTVTGAIGDGATLSFGSTLSVLKAAQVGSASITAPAIGSASTTAAGGLAGDFGADLTLTGGAPSGVLLKSLSVKGNLADVTIAAATGTIGTIQAASIGAATISAINLGSIKTTAGNFAGLLNLSGLASAKPTLSQVSVKGVASGARINITAGKFNSIKAQSFSDVQINAPTLASLASRGDVTNSQFTLSGEAGQFALGSASIKGVLDGSTIAVRNGNVKSIVVGGMDGSGVFVGIGAVSSPPTTAADFVTAGAQLRSLAVRNSGGRTYDLVDSRIVAPNIGSIVTGVLDTQTGSPFIAADSLASLVLTQLDIATNKTTKQVSKTLDDPSESITIDNASVAIV